MRLVSKARQDEFRGWPQAKCNRLVGALAALVRDELAEAVTICLPYKQFVAEYRETPFPKGVQRFSQYGVCLYILVDALALFVRRRQGKHRLNLVVEAGHANAGAAVTVFEAIKHHLTDGSSLLGTVTIAKKDECELLMMADFQAHASGISDSWERTGRPGYVRLVGDRQPGHGEAAINFVHVNAGTLQRIKDRFMQQQSAKHEAYLKRKAARHKGESRLRARLPVDR
jgi:hypothetical protein